MSSLLLSIVTINRNNAAGVRRTLASLAPVSEHDDVELLFIDGASQDASVAIAREFYEPDRLLSEPDSGVYDAMNKGLRLATAEYVLWINSGDELLPETLPDVLAELRRQSAALVCFGIEAVSESGGGSRRLFSTPHEMPFTVLHHQGACFRRTAALAMGGYDESYRIVGDQELMQRMFAAGHTFVAPPLVIARFHEGGLSFTRRRFAEEYSMQRRLGLISGWQHASRLGGLWYVEVKKGIKRTLAGKVVTK